MAARLRLSLLVRRLRTDDTLRTFKFANGRVAQHPLTRLEVGVGVPRLLVGRASGNQEAAPRRASGLGVRVSRLRVSAEGLVDDLPHWQVPTRAWPGGGGTGRVESCECLTASGNRDPGTYTGPRPSVRLCSNTSLLLMRRLIHFTNW